MANRIEELRRLAQGKFLGQGPVIGIGIGGRLENELVFVLEEESADIERQIRRWAGDQGVPVQIRISGPITLLNAESH